MDNAKEFLERCDRLMLGQDPKDILRRARARLEDDTKWTVGAPARNAEGAWRKPDAPDAVRWDIQGAIAIECNPYGILPPFFMKLLDELVAPLGCDSVGVFNDTFSHDKMLELFDAAIASCP